MISGNPKLVNWKEPNGNSLLHILSYSNMDKQIRLLLKHEADPNVKNMVRFVLQLSICILKLYFSLSIYM